MQHYRLLGAPLICAVLCLVLSACGSPRLNETQTLPPGKPEYHLGRGDVLNIRFRYWPELDVTETIRPDGRISLYHLGDVPAAGLSVAELQEYLIVKYAAHIKNPDIIVVLRDATSARVFVGGEVLSPGPVPYVQDLDILQAIMVAGGFNKESAKLENVILIRHLDGKRYATSVDVKQGLTQLQSDMLVLAPNDIVFVPRTHIDEVNQWVDQHINGVFSGLLVNPKTVDSPVGYNGIGR